MIIIDDDHLYLYRHELMREGEAGGVGDPGDAEEDQADHGLQRLPGQLDPGLGIVVTDLLLLRPLHVDDDVVGVVLAAPVAHPVLETLRPLVGLVVGVENIVESRKFNSDEILPHIVLEFKKY